MTLIGGFHQPNAAANEPSLPKLVVGQAVQARVLGPSRHGVLIQIGRETFQLAVRSRFAEAKTLTLEGAAAPSASRQRVLVIASDDRPITQPFEAELIAKAKRVSPSASTIVQKSEIKVLAQPVNPEGKIQGRSVTLHLQASPPETATKLAAVYSEQIGNSDAKHATAHVVRGNAVTGETPITTSNTPAQQPAVADRKARAPASNIGQADQTGVHRSQAGTGAPNPITTNGGMVQRLVATQTVPSTESTSANTQASRAGLSPAWSVVGDLQPEGRPLTGRQSAATLVLSADGESGSIKNTPTSVASAYRGAAAHEPTGQSQPMPKASLSLELYPAVDRKGAIPATVIGHTDTGKVILNAADQHFRVEQPLDLPLGTTLQMSVISGVSASMMPLDPGASGDPPTPLAKLIELLDAIDRAGRQATEADRPSPGKHLPAPDRHLASRYLGLLASSEGQPFEGKASPASQQSGMATMQMDQVRLLARELGSMASESLDDGWKGLTLPLGSDQAQAVSVYFRDHNLDPDGEASDGDADQAETQRAVFDVSFSQLGRCQIDALCQNQRFDVQIRSERAFLPEDEQAIAALYISALDIAGMHGEIGFNIGSFFEAARPPAAIKDVRT